MKRIILHADMDSFYAAVEQREDPALKGLPVVVGSDPKSGRGVVSTCSYEARTFGIRSAMPITKAYRLCSHAVFLPVNMPLYAKVSGSIMDILGSYADRFQQVSVDEAYLDITDRADSYKDAESLARNIKAHIMEKEKLTCSIGIAPNKAVAKIASDLHKPDGLTVVEPDRIVEFLEPLEIRRLSGIGAKGEEVLHGMGIRTIGQLARMDERVLVETFGKWGVRLHRMAWGLDDGEVKQREESRSVSKEHTFMEDTADHELLLESLDHIAGKVHRVLLLHNYSFRTVSVKVRQEDFTTFTRSRTLSFDSKELNIIRQMSRELCSEFFDGRRIRLLGVKLSNLGRGEGRQMRLTDFI